MTVVRLVVALLTFVLIAIGFRVSTINVEPQATQGLSQQRCFRPDALTRSAGKVP